uniref:Uncharacterized protein n=1 Tax=Chelonoidis abingdonii TaxID=106734 RepID=A0A8C0GPA9_CHEAB
MTRRPSSLASLLLHPPPRAGKITRLCPLPPFDTRSDLPHLPVISVGWTSELRSQHKAPSASGSWLCLASRQGLNGAFSPCRGTTAVCAYSMDKVTHAFKTSKLKGYANVLPAHRPGTVRPAQGAVRVPKRLPGSNEGTPVSDSERRTRPPSPLLTILFHSFHSVSHRLQGDRVPSSEFPISLAAADKGKIHKVLQTGEQTVIIAELSPFQRDVPISGMALDAFTGHLYVATEFEVTRLPLADCGQYRETCWKCVLAKDPYCGWDPDGKKCSAISGERSRFQTEDPAQRRPEALKKVSVDPTSYIYLPCPLRSHHAIYTWVKDGSKQYPCAMDGHSCTLRFGENTPMDQGLFKCTATEDGYLEEITAYKLTLSAACIPPLSVTVAAGALFLVVTILLL